jgi:type IV pilus assembly protein PilQ
MKIKFFVILMIGFLSLYTNAQDRFEILEQKLVSLAKTTPGLNEKVDVSVNGVSIQEFIRGIANNNNLNVNVDPILDIKITNNFSKVNAQEVFLFLCKRYDLDINFVGPILSFTKYVAPVSPVKSSVRKINLKYEPTAGLLSYDLVNDTLSSVTKEITKQSGKNIIFSPDLAGKMVNGFVQAVPIMSALEKLAFTNDMKVSETQDGFFVLEKKAIVQDPKNPNTGNNPFPFSGNNANSKTGSLVVKGGLITMDVQNMLMGEVVNAVLKEVGKNYFLFSELKGSATVKVTDAPLDEFLKLLFNGTDFTFKKEGDVYLFGDRNLEGLRQSKLISLKNRTIDLVLDYIPADLKKGIDIKLYKDLNGFIVSGSQPRINELESFIRQIDMVVPLVHIEVIIADIRKSNTVSTGISAGIGSKPANATTGSVLPGFDFSINSSSINNLISGINGLGVINLGSVTPNFYLTLKALEEQGVLKLRSTPQIATLNGHEAKLSVGQTEYYLEVQNNLVNNPNATNNILQSQQYKPVNADLAVTINPQVSGDEQITMSINVKQSSFTERISNTAPPGSLNRDFQSLIRVKNGEMIMLGGLEENTINNSSSGLPLLSRIPVLKWIFGNRTRKKSDNKLTIFIKPTIIYG